MKSGIVILAVIVVVIIAIGVYYLSQNSSGNHGPLITVPYNLTTNTTVKQTAYSTVSQTSTINTNTTIPCTTTIISKIYSVNIASSAKLGSYLTDERGFTLYYYKGDTQNSGQSNCNGGCAGAWPPFYNATIVVQSSLNASNFSAITRSDGSTQTTYKGWPLYYFAGDNQAGQANGQGQSNFFVAALNLT